MTDREWDKPVNPTCPTCDHKASEHHPRSPYTRTGSCGHVGNTVCPCKNTPEAILAALPEAEA